MTNGQQEEERMDAEARAVDSQREPDFLLAKWEKRLLCALAARLPRFILPDDLSARRLVSRGYSWMSRSRPRWMAPEKRSRLPSRLPRMPSA